MSQNLWSAAVVIDALRVYKDFKLDVDASDIGEEDGSGMNHVVCYFSKIDF